MSIVLTKSALRPISDQLTESISLANVISALSYALDITEGQPEGHSSRSCLIAMRIADVLQLTDVQRSDLFYGTLLKDSGCSSNAAKVCALFGADDRSIKKEFKVHDLTNKITALNYMARNIAPGQSLMRRATKLLTLICKPTASKDLIQARCSRGADIAKKLGFSDSTAETVRALDEHWNGKGEPYRLKGDQIPLLGRIACLAQTVEVYFTTYGMAAAIDVAKERSGTWFDPNLVAALVSLKSDKEFWQTLATGDVRQALAEMEHEEQRVFVDEDRLDAIAEGFADIVDAKSPWTFHHSYGVAEAMDGILNQFGHSDESRRYWRRAALLHDIGKLGVSNLILDKPGKLTEGEFGKVKEHVDHTRRILHFVPCFRSFANEAAAHHEKLDGSGYSLGLTSDQLSQEAKALCVADIFDALSAKRPYNDRHRSLDEVFDIMDKEAKSKICPVSYEAIRLHVQASYV